ncbi:DUF4232 domain-containing protein [Streptomyces sp. NPDC060194]|uniref:DUF4232 domain-containing protein n=1 Tax=Streptomyces sp. NPDC060194 TaxID=3347069 RepID=UPI003657639C
MKPATAHPRRVPLLVALAAGGVVALSACGAGAAGGGDGSDAADTPPSAAASSPEQGSSNSPAPQGSSVPSAPSGTAGDSATSAPPARGSDCTTGDLKARLAFSGQEMNSRYFDLTLTNTGTGTCSLSGYPGLSVTDATGKRIGEPATRSANGSVANVTLAAGQAAHAVVQTPGRDVTDGNCWTKPADFTVYPPNNTAALTAPVPDTLEICGDTFTVGPVTSHAP